MESLKSHAISSWAQEEVEKYVSAIYVIDLLHKNKRIRSVYLPSVCLHKTQLI